MPRVDEAVLERSADIVSRQTCDRRHHVSGELADLESPFVLTSPPVVLRPDGENLSMKQDRKKTLTPEDVKRTHLPSIMVMTSLIWMWSLSGSSKSSRAHMSVGMV